MDVDQAIVLLTERAHTKERSTTALLAPMAVEEVEEAIRGSAVAQKRVRVAAVNTPKSVVLTGCRKTIEAMLIDKGVAEKAIVMDSSWNLDRRRVASSVASKFNFDAPKNIGFVSSLLGGADAAKVCTSSYWARHATQTVRFLDAVKASVAAGGRVFLDLGRHPSLTAMAKQCVPPEQTDTLAWIPVLRSPGDPRVWLHSIKDTVSRAQTKGRTTGSAIAWRHQQFPWVKGPMETEPIIVTTTKPSSKLRLEEGVEEKDLDAHIKAVVAEAMLKVVGTPEQMPNVDAPLMDSGIDSLGAVEFKNNIEERLGIALAPTVLFDHPTLEDIQRHICSLHKETAGAPTHYASLGSRDADRFALIGMACRLPGSSNSPDQFWNMMMTKTDCVDEIPMSRFNVDSLYDPDPTKDKICAREAALIDGVDKFDHNFFHIKQEDAAEMDPQQRILL
eukprot:GHVS01064657.1.p1 GENE.GHVS01064657.1~~GHVS01064657.1.p1  ORF type:complete len:470 (+),score=87.51 GHVS01064657.1:70-1410(+)